MPWAGETVSPERRESITIVSEGNSMNMLALSTKPKKNINYNRTYFNKGTHSNPPPFPPPLCGFIHPLIGVTNFHQGLVRCWALW